MNGTKDASCQSAVLLYTFNNFLSSAGKRHEEVLMQVQRLLSDCIHLGKSTRQGITLMGFSLSLVLFFKIFDFLLEKLDFMSTL
jgi:hypothetical protein